MASPTTSVTRRSLIVLAFGASTGMALGMGTPGCLSGTFNCTTDAECEGAGPAPTCEPTGYCSYYDPECPSERRYGELADARSGLCVSHGDEVAGTDGEGETDTTPSPGDSAGGPTPSDGETGGNDEGSDPGEAGTTSGGDDGSPPAGGDTSGGGGDAGGADSGADDDGGVPGDASGERPGRVLMIVDEDTDPVGDDAVVERLEDRGLVVERIDDDEARIADFDGHVLVLLSSTTASNAVDDEFRNVRVPVLVWEHNLFDDMGMSEDNGTERGQFVNIVDDEHPLAANTSGVVRVFNDSQVLRGGNPGPGATVIAETISEPPLAALFVYEAGSPMPGGDAPGLRIGLFLDNDSASDLTDDGAAMLEAALDLALAQ